MRTLLYILLSLITITSASAEIFFRNASLEEILQTTRNFTISLVNDIEMSVSYINFAEASEIIELLPDGTMLRIGHSREIGDGETHTTTRIGSYVIKNDTLIYTPHFTGDSENFTTVDSLPFLVNYYDYPKMYKYNEGRELIEITSFNIQVIDSATTISDELKDYYKNMELSRPPLVLRRVLSYFADEDSVTDINIQYYDTTTADIRENPLLHIPRPEGLQIIPNQFPNTESTTAN